jgi:hypothetical protein
MAIKIGLAVTDRRPPKPGIVLVRFKGDPTIRTSSSAGTTARASATATAM